DSRRSLGARLLRQQLTIDLVFAEFLPGTRAVLAEDVHPGVDEVAVLQHLQPRLRARVPEIGPQDEKARRRLSSRQAVAIHAGGEVLAPGLRVTNLPKNRVDLDALDRLAGHVLQLERDARHQLVLAVLDAGIVPAGVDVGDLDRFLDVEVAPAAGNEER